MQNVFKLLHLFGNVQDYNLLSHLSQRERKLTKKNPSLKRDYCFRITKVRNRSPYFFSVIYILKLVYTPVVQDWLFTIPSTLNFLAKVQMQRHIKCLRELPIGHLCSVLHIWSLEHVHQGWLAWLIESCD